MDELQNEVQSGEETVEITATVAEMSLTELEGRLAEAERQIGELVASAASREESAGRKTVKTVAAMAGKHGASTTSSALDGALRSLSIEQRIAVKTELMRSGLLQ